MTPITADLPAPHAFFTRAGGVSTGIFAGLNCGPGSHDDPAAVTRNRERVARHMDIAPERLLSLHQIHSDVIVQAAPETWSPRPKADAMVTDAPGIGLGILAADCAPVLFADAEAGVIGAAHAGWKGAIGGVLEATLDGMEGLGAARGRVAAVVGPCISQRAYEVGPEFFETFEADDPETVRFFAQGAGDRLQFDLPGFVLHRLRTAGIGAASWTGHCTYSDPELFFSYRRATHRGEPDYGRLISVIRL